MSYRLAPDQEAAIDLTAGVDLDVTLRAPGILVLSEIAYPGWSVRGDGRPCPCAPMGYCGRWLCRQAPGMWNGPINRVVCILAWAWAS